MAASPIVHYEDCQDNRTVFTNGEPAECIGCGSKRVRPAPVMEPPVFYLDAGLLKMLKSLMDHAGNYMVDDINGGRLFGSRYRIIKLSELHGDQG